LGLCGESVRIANAAERSHGRFGDPASRQHLGSNWPDFRLVGCDYSRGHLFIGHSADVRSAVAAFLKQTLPDGFPRGTKRSSTLYLVVAICGVCSPIFPE
jgi:hypothetical protein